MKERLDVLIGCVFVELSNVGLYDGMACQMGLSIGNVGPLFRKRRAEAS